MFNFYQTLLAFTILSACIVISVQANDNRAENPSKITAMYSKLCNDSIIKPATAAIDISRSACIESSSQRVKKGVHNLDAISSWSTNVTARIYNFSNSSDCLPSRENYIINPLSYDL